MFGLSGAAVAGIAGTVGGALISSKGAKDAAKIAAQGGQLDPRIASLIFGENGQPGLISQYQELGKTPRSDAALGFAGANEQYLTNNGGADLGAIRQTALGAIGGNSAPMSTAAQAGPAAQMTSAAAPTAATGAAWAALPSYAKGNMVEAPSQNNINLTPTYQSMLAGGDTSKLMDSLQAGNALAGAQFRQNQSDLTDNLQRNILPGIRSNSVLAGQYGGSRQGVAEGLVMSDLTKQLNNSNTQFGLGATAASSAALASNYENGQNRALSAAQGLGAQQYATAFKDADTKNQAEFMNVANQFDASKTNAGFAQQTNLANLGTTHAMNLARLGADQQTNQFNAGQTQQNNQFNTGLQQQTNLANQGAQLSTNAQNNSAGLGGAGLLSGLLGQVGGAVNANDNWDITRAGQINSLLAPLIGASPTQNPVASNSGAAALGGGLAGLSLGNSLAGLFGGGQSSQFQGEKMGGMTDLFGGKFMNF